MNSLQTIAPLSTPFSNTILFPNCSKRPPKPTEVRFYTETLIRIDDHGDNWMTKKTGPPSPNCHPGGSVETEQRWSLSGQMP
jgi:hypothetical protein